MALKFSAPAINCMLTHILKTPLVAQTEKHLPIVWETTVQSLGREDPLEKEMSTTPVLLPGKFYGWRSLVRNSPWGHKELDTTERLHFSLTHKLNMGLNIFSEACYILLFTKPNSSHQVSTVITSSLFIPSNPSLFMWLHFAAQNAQLATC